MISLTLLIWYNDVCFYRETKMINPDIDAEGILKYAIGKEIEANVFYNLLSQYIDDENLKTVCNDFALEELEHKARLELELMKLGRVIKSAPVVGLGEGSFPKPLDFILKMAKVVQLSLQEIMVIAMEKEKTAFTFYVDSLAKVKDPQARQVLMELAEEEARHKLRFELENDRLKAEQL